MSEVFEELVAASQVENKLTGQTKMANEEQHPDHTVDRDVKLMGDGKNVPATTTEGPSPKARAAAASAVSPADRAAVEGFKKTMTGDGPPTKK